MTDLRMDAYYYGFSKTGCPEVDLVLSAVACAGKSYHHTESWCDDSEAWPGHRGVTPADWIQCAGDDAAKAVLALRDENARLRTALAKIDAIRNDIIGRQKMGWSKHIYPMVAALDEAGYPGVGYEEARRALLGETKP